MNNWTVDDVKKDKINGLLLFSYSCSTKKDITKAIDFHKNYYNKQEFQPVKVNMIQFMDWLDGGKGIWSVTISHRDTLA
tara:strand:- start:16 stop:252 length:237 start_codon:yes stop_codon:yes gene_type:complete